MTIGTVKWLGPSFKVYNAKESICAELFQAMRLLIVEDDRELREGLCALLRQAGYEVDSHADGRDAFNSLLSSEYDLAIVDLMLPGMDGLALVRNLRRQLVGLPILIITARDALEDRVSGLDAGADDYLVKPFEMPELEARVRALLRRRRADRDEEIRVGPLVLVAGQPRVILGETSFDLPASEMALLETLAIRAGRVVSKQAIADRLSRGGNPPSDTAIEICVHRLRRRLGPYGLKVRTLRGFGYMLESDEPRTSSGSPS
jgi:two-component system, OmpR family, response regulator